MLDIISNYLSTMKAQQGGVSLVPGGATPAGPLGNNTTGTSNAPKSFNRGSDTTQASTTTSGSQQSSIQTGSGR